MAPGSDVAPDGLRVLHLDTARTWRGGQQQVLLLHRELLRLGVDSRVLVRAGGELAARLQELSGRPAPTFGSPWSPDTVASVSRRARGADVVHAHDPHAAGLAAVAGALGRSAPLVCHRRVAYPLRRGLVHRLKYRRVARWVAVGGAVRRSLVAGGVPPERIRVVPSALDLDGFRRTATTADLGGLRRELGVAEDALVVGLTGALEVQKGHRVLLEAAGRVLSASSKAVLVWVGEGPCRRELEQAALGSGVAGRLRLLGFRRDVAAVTALYDVAVVPSVDGEGSSAALKEAMALGKPVVASDLDANREVLADAGLLVPVGDADRLAGELVRLLENRGLRAELGGRAARRVERFRPAAMVAAMTAVYRELTAGVHEARR